MSRDWIISILAICCLAVGLLVARMPDAAQCTTDSECMQLCTSDDCDGGPE